MTWKAQAECLNVGPEIFFPTSSNSEEALKYCNRCVVKAECLDYALENNDFFGIWGGMDIDQRRAEERRRRLAE